MRRALLISSGLSSSSLRSWPWCSGAAGLLTSLKPKHVRFASHSWPSHSGWFPHRSRCLESCFLSLNQQETQRVTPHHTSGVLILTMMMELVTVGLWTDQAAIRQAMAERQQHSDTHTHLISASLTGSSLHSWPCPLTTNPTPVWWPHPSLWAVNNISGAALKRTI